MSVVAGVRTATGAEGLLRDEAQQKAFPRTKRALVVAVALLALPAAFAVLIPASQAPKADHNYYSAVNTHDSRVPLTNRAWNAIG